MRLEIVAPPDVVDRGLAHPLAFGHQPATPVRHPFRLAAQGGVHDRFNLLRSISWFATAPGSYFPQAVQALLRKARTPQHHRLAINLQPSRNLTVGLPFGRCQHDTASQRNLLRRTVRVQPLLDVLLDLSDSAIRARMFGAHSKIIRIARKLSSYLLDITLGAGDSRIADRSAVARGQAPASGGFGRRQGRAGALLHAIAEVPDDVLRESLGALADRRVPLRSAPLSRSRIHVQACVDPRGRLRQRAPGAAAGAPRAHRRGAGGARRESTGRARRSARASRVSG